MSQVYAPRSALLPRHFLRNPVVFLDSGRSADESYFLEHWRYQVESIYQRELPNETGNNHNFWILYPDRTKAARYGSRPISEYDKWEIRPIRRERENLREGTFATVAAFEKGCQWLHIPAPWRTYNRKHRRACVVYLNPKPHDVAYISRTWDEWRRSNNVDAFYWGPVFGKGFPTGYLTYTSGAVCFTQEGFNAARASLANTGKAVARIFWETLFAPRPANGPTYAFAPSWGHADRDRLDMTATAWAQSWRPGEVWADPAADSWQAVQAATAAKFYIILSRKEQFPFDALIASARGATIVAPDIPLYRNIRVNKILYPCFTQTHNQCALSLPETREFLKETFKHQGRAWLPS